MSVHVGSDAFALRTQRIEQAVRLDAFRLLSQDERFLLVWRYLQGKLLDECAARIGRSRSCTARAIERALGKLPR